ncbi:hypothetical protein ARC20_03285 [Stenotrophomonas panacihumi]|uniref:Uncharacterized protein n=1 Tax=Stenotrophomonas panacihumi TaxID=676599 RepID=A0A0R0AQ44_9GAMM|nr:hypothetical protein [Stenotrophomonas panacihumi]KRG47366.1 hypothetical protein ARC20_03285 [Stenotrophomonas panacihumi]PTN55844.1 hypothetical protein C9J98_04525 [Stenotrophomonas panacihumi]
MTLTPAAKKIRAKRAARPIYAVVERVAVLSTGEERLALLAENPVDRELMKQRGYRRGQELRLEVKAPRNRAFHRLAHAVGQLMVDNVEGWEGLDSHEAVKRLQREAGVCCEVIEMDASPVISAVLATVDQTFGAGAAKLLRAVLPEIKTIPVTVARSLAFDSMDEDEFGRLFEGINAYIGANYTHVLLDDVRAEFWRMAQGDRAGGEQRRRAA